MTHPIRHLIDVVHASDGFKQQQLAAIWPELAEAVAGVIEGMTDQDAPAEWWPEPEDGYSKGIEKRAREMWDETNPDMPWRDASAPLQNWYLGVARSELYPAGG